MASSSVTCAGSAAASKLNARKSIERLEIGDLIE
jgi:hypothetical protein